ncbi:MAG: hypothetical protein CMI63_05535 [Parvularcula sp.]|nr:hypothetical protein [Parvularcula sp.]
MVVRRSMIAALLIAGALLSAYASGSSGGGFVHGVLMRGQVVRAAPTETIICIWRADGAAPGRIFIIYRYLDPGSEGADFIREDVGTAEVIELVDMHFARVRVISGDVKKHDIVERAADENDTMFRRFI